MTAEGIVGEYLDLRREADADVLAMQMGDFYEFFGEDAEFVGEELDLKVSERSSGGESYAMAGVPVDDLTPYLTALVERGYRVAVADQHEIEGGHERRIDRVVTPGTLVDPTGDDAQYLATVVRGDDGLGLAFLDITTGRFHVTATEGEDSESRALTELYRFAPTEILPGPDLRGDDDVLDRIRERLDATLTVHATDDFAPGRANHRLRDQFGDAADAIGLDGEAATQAAGAALAYVDETGTGVLASVTRLRTYTPDDHVTLDATTQRNLELTEPMTERGVSLFDTLDHTETSAGGRLLKEWLGRPIRRRGELEARQQAIGALAADAMGRDRLRESLAGAYDLERLASRAVSGSLDAPAMLRVRDTLALLPDLVDAVESSPRLAGSAVADVLDSLDRAAARSLHDDLAEAITDDPPSTLTEGGLIRPEYDEELAALVERHETALDWLDSLAARERKEHGLAHVSVGRNKTDGYYIQVGKSSADDVPDHYEPVKTLKNSQRFTTPELRETERDVVQLEEQRGELEYELFRELREQVAAAAPLCQGVGETLAELDVYAALATHAAGNDWARPELTDEDVLAVEAGRHPVVEQSVEFVPNDLHFDRDRRFLLVTGPNMSGKSTYMRQAALVTLLAQIGSFVPADAATVGLVDGVFTRVGALDELAQGRSTFMVEMQELSNILHSASDDSLVILDEVGRGTATYDGISIAWAAMEYLSSAQPNSPSPKVLFATHYHELTRLADHIAGVENVHVAADGEGDDVTFLRTVEPGATDRSYGIHVASLAGVPGPVVDRAREVLDRLREDKAIDVRGRAADGTSETTQVTFDLSSGQFEAGDEDGEAPAQALDPDAEAVLDALREVDVTETSPVELLGQVQEWQSRLEE
ncbi:DNA mismatch repair protein MutS [Halosegnis rubeus]|uniref:DNA mismatch repair protein MutS n=1 Tax=Halosegnis rubeus TaxID=2212850 RepID=A0A5N5UBY3_9EURY|nr:DNA mismatch repair protein MutS [Halosegnis rubeus]KAB7515391.1 DNA mismatch repair protein MutS [Halosegnis rubeus]